MLLVGKIALATTSPGYALCREYGGNDVIQITNVMDRNDFCNMLNPA